MHHCIHGSAYDARVWRAELPQAEAAVLDAAGRVGAVVVFPESLYSYGPVDGPMTEDLPRTATAGKLGVRTELLAQRAASATPTVSVAASDFYGPVVRTAHAGERLVPTVLAGRTMRVLGSLDQPHSFTYVPDLAAAMIEAAARPELWDSFLHAPTAAPVTQRRLVELVAEAGGVPVPRMSAIPAWVLRASGVVSRDMRELAETAYMFSDPFVLDSTASEQRLGLSPTPIEAGLAATVAWWRRAGARGRLTGVRTSNPRHSRHWIAFGPCSPRSSSPTAVRSQSVPSEPPARSARRPSPSSRTRTGGPSTG